MKRLFALLMTAMMVCGLCMVSASADNEDTNVISPEIVSPEIVSPEIVSPEFPGTDDPGSGAPGEDTPGSPQTGYTIGIVGLTAAAAASGAVAVFTGKKAKKR